MFYNYLTVMAGDTLGFIENKAFLMENDFLSA
jgi:hypothetical protein